MPKHDKTRKEKIRSEARRKESELFSVDPAWLKSGTKTSKPTAMTEVSGKKYLNLDLTKTFLLSMLVLALEFALWKYLSRH